MPSLIAIQFTLSPVLFASGSEDLAKNIATAPLPISLIQTTACDSYQGGREGLSSVNAQHLGWMYGFRRKK